MSVGILSTGSGLDAEDRERISFRRCITCFSRFTEHIDNEALEQVMLEYSQEGQYDEKVLDAIQRQA